MSQEAINAIIRFSFIVLVPCLIIFAIVILIRIFKKASVSNSEREKTNCSTTITTKVVRKRENVVLNPNSTMTFYYYCYTIVPNFALIGKWDNPQNSRGRVVQV